MSKADNIFEELGFEIKASRLEVIRYKNNYHGGKLIEFNLEFKEYETSNSFKHLDVDVKLHIAIHEKIKELGWLDE